MKREPHYNTPGQLIQELMEKRGWSQRVLAVVLQADVTGINKILTGKRPIDANMALDLAKLFNMPAERFMDLQKSYELAQARILTRENPEMDNRAQLFGTLPVAEMLKRGWLDASDIREYAKVESALLKFFNAQSIEEIEVFPHVAKKTAITGDATPSQLAWLYRVKEIAEEMLVPRYSKEAAADAISKMKPLLLAPDATRKVPRILFDCGIRFVIVEALTGSKIDGVCFWLNDKSPVIGMTLRFDRIDNFWFVLRHELEHVIQGHGRGAVMLDTELDQARAGTGDDLTEEERIANRAAAEFCVPQKSLQAFIDRKAPICREQDVIGFARTLHVHPGLVAGQLQHKLKRYDRFRNHLVKIRSAIAPSAMVDGWGDIAPVGEE